MIRVAVVGATGYAGRESIRILLAHPSAKPTYLCALPEECAPIDQIFPAFRGRIDLPVEPLDVDKARASADVVFCCLPHKVSMSLVPRLLAAGLRVIDFSADYRLKSPDDYEQWYETPHGDVANLERAVYGLPEFFRDSIRQAVLLANPGCYPTGALLGIGPLLRAELIDPADIIVNAASGVSGAGRQPKPQHHFPERNENFEAYRIGAHPHLIEIQRVLESLVRGVRADVLFAPHVVPMERGILSTIYLRPRQHVSVDHLTAVYAEAYAGEPFIRLRRDLPATHDVAYTNFCDIGVRVIGSHIVVVTAIDNMVKGAAGQAVQNMNLMFGLEETAGLL